MCYHQTPYLPLKFSYPGELQEEKWQNMFTFPFFGTEELTIIYIIHFQFTLWNMTTHNIKDKTIYKKLSDT